MVADKVRKKSMLIGLVKRNWYWFYGAPAPPAAVPLLWSWVNSCSSWNETRNSHHWLISPGSFHPVCSLPPCLPTSLSTCLPVSLSLFLARQVGPLDFQSFSTPIFRTHSELTVFMSERKID